MAPAAAAATLLLNATKPAHSPSTSCCCSLPFNQSSKDVLVPMVQPMYQRDEDILAALVEGGKQRERVGVQQGRGYGSSPLKQGHNDGD